MNLTIPINPAGPDDCTGCDRLGLMFLGGSYHSTCRLFSGDNPLCQDGPDGHAFPTLECVFHRALADRDAAKAAIMAHGFSLSVENYEREHKS